MNIARWFSYTRLLERSLIKERLRHERERKEDRAQWETERQQLEDARARIENVVFQAHGVNTPHPHLSRVPTNGDHVSKPPIPRAIGPIGQFGLAARNAFIEQDAENRLGNEVRRDPSNELSAEEQERIRKAAAERGIVAPGSSNETAVA
jgi:hypothetical protein